MPFASHLAMSIGFFIGIIPAVIIIFMTLEDYDDYYEDKQFFYLLVVGLFAGMVTSLVYYWSIIYMAENLFLLVFILVVFGFAIYEMLLFTIILSMKRFGAKFDLTHYGVVLGGSVGGILCMFVVYVFLSTRELTGVAIISMILLVPTLPLFYTSLGAMVGYGLFTNNFFKYSISMVVLKGGFNFIFIFWFILFLDEPIDRGWQFMLIGLVFAVLMYLYLIRTLLPSALPEHLRKHRRRQRRSAKRR